MTSRRVRESTEEMPGIRIGQGHGSAPVCVVVGVPEGGRKTMEERDAEVGGAKTGKSGVNGLAPGLMSWAVPHDVLEGMFWGPTGRTSGSVKVPSLE